MATQQIRNTTAGKVPSPAELLEGQIGLNLSDRIIYTKDHNGNIIPLGSVTEIVNTLTETASGKALDARQGKALKQDIDAINALLSSDDTTLDEMQEVVDFIKANRADLNSLSIANVAGLQAALDSKEAAFSKNTAFNKNFGTGHTEVSRGDHSHDDGYYTGV